MNPFFAIAIFAGVLVVVVFFDCVSQFTSQRKSFGEIKAGFRRTVLRMFLTLVVMLISSLVWWHMGWKDGQEIHLHWPWHSN